MFLNPWSLTLCLLGGLSIFLVAMAARTAVRVLRFWNPADDSQRQIRLESEIWLSSTLVQYGLGFQIVSLLLFVLAADYFSQMIAGAMCATGSLLANDYGVPLLLVKGVGVFFYGLWIIIHQIDISSEEYPLVRAKYLFLLLLVPIVIADLLLLLFYLAGLEPDVITSCCAIIFDEQAGSAVMNLVAGRQGQFGLGGYYVLTLVLVMLGALAWWRQSMATYTIYGVAMVFFFVLALHTLTTELSSFIYAMPFHNCPFCMLKKEYGHIGFFIYISLFTATFCGVAAMLIELCKVKRVIVQTVTQVQRRLVAISVLALLMYTALSSYHLVMYMLLGGEG